MPTVLCMVPYADKTWDLDLYNHDDRRSLEVVVLASGPEGGGNSWPDISLRAGMALALVVLPSL